MLKEGSDQVPGTEISEDSIYMGTESADRSINIL